MSNKICQERLRSKAAWVTTVSIILAIAGNVGLYDVVGINEGTIQNVITSILSLLGVWGVWNDPTNKTGF